MMSRTPPQSFFRLLLGALFLKAFRQWCFVEHRHEDAGDDHQWDHEHEQGDERVVVGGGDRALHVGWQRVDDARRERVRVDAERMGAAQRFQPFDEQMGQVAGEYRSGHG